MDIQIDGNRSSSESWQAAQLVADDALPPITSEEEQVARKLSIPFDGYRRSKYAANLTKVELEDRARRVGLFVSGWLESHGLKSQVRKVMLKTFAGKYMVEAMTGTDSAWLSFDEDLIDDLLDSGSREAEEKLDRLLTSNFFAREASRAS